jgi:hypothetical protein
MGVVKVVRWSGWSWRRVELPGAGNGEAYRADIAGRYGDYMLCTRLTEERLPDAGTDGTTGEYVAVAYYTEEGSAAEPQPWPDELRFSFGGQAASCLSNVRVAWFDGEPGAAWAVQAGPFNLAPEMDASGAPTSDGMWYVSAGTPDEQEVVSDGPFPTEAAAWEWARVNGWSDGPDQTQTVAQAKANLDRAFGEVASWVSANRDLLDEALTAQAMRDVDGADEARMELRQVMAAWRDATLAVLAAAAGQREAAK